ncbi:MAG: ATPase domain-containing protein [Thermoprotei archaeon]
MTGLHDSEQEAFLLFMLRREKEKLSGLIEFDGDCFSVKPGSRFLNLDAEELLGRLNASGAVVKVREALHVVCSSCGGGSMEATPICGVHGSRLSASKPEKFGLQVKSTEVGGNAADGGQGSALFCEQCGGHPATVSYLLRCDRCGVLQDWRNPVTVGVGVYKLDGKMPVEVKLLESVYDVFAEKGFRTEVLGSVDGKLGVRHFFDVVARQEYTTYAVNVMAHRNGSADVNAVLGGYAESVDLSGVAEHLLVAYPSLDAESEKLSAAYGLNVVEVGSEREVFSRLGSKLKFLGETASLKTGVEGLDRLLGGGFLPGRVYLVLGEAGTGKTILSIQFALQAAKTGGSSMFITTNSTPEEVIDIADRVELPLRKYVNEGKVVVVDTTHQLDEIKSHGADDVWKYKSFVAKVVGEIKGKLAQVGATRLVIDSVTPLIPDGGYDRVREFLTALGQLGCLVIVTKEGNDAVEENFVAGTIAIQSKLVGDEYVKFLSVRKVRGMAHDSRIHEFSIVPRKGVVVKD